MVYNFRNIKLILGFLYVERKIEGKIHAISKIIKVEREKT